MVSVTEQKMAKGLIVAQNRSQIAFNNIFLLIRMKTNAEFLPI
jgi:hypothetical protein